MKKLLIILLSAELFFAGNLRFVKNSALIYQEKGVKKVIVLRNVEQMNSKIKERSVDVTLYMNSGRVIHIDNLSVTTYKSLENTLTNATMRILKEIK